MNNKRLRSVTDCILYSKVMNNKGDLESGERSFELGQERWPQCNCGEREYFIMEATMEAKKWLT